MLPSPTVSALALLLLPMLFFVRTTDAKTGENLDPGKEKSSVPGLVGGLLSDIVGKDGKSGGDEINSINAVGIAIDNTLKLTGDSKRLQNGVREEYSTFNASGPGPEASRLATDAAVSLAGPHPEIFGGIAAGRLFEAGRYSEAREQADAAIEAGDKSADNYYLRGASSEKLGDLAQAREDAAEALSLDKGNKKAESLFKLTERKIGPVGEASVTGREEPATVRRQDSEEDEVAPDSIDKRKFARSSSLTDGAQQRLKVKDLTGALDLLDKALRLNPEDARAYHLRADVNMRLKRHEAAERDASRLLEVLPGHTGGLNMRSLARNRLGKSQAALEDAEAAVKSNSFSGMAHYNRAFALAGLGRRAEAAEALQRASQVDSKYRGLYVRLAGLPADADPVLVFGEAAETGEPSAAVPAGVAARRRPVWVWALALAGLALAGFGLAKSRFVRTTLRRRLGPRPGREAELGPTLAPADGSGALLGRYRIEREVAAGGMGVVFEAFDEALQRKVAVKRMRPEIRANPRERERFLAEARTVASLRHPNIVEIHSIEDDGRDGYLIFEFVEGATLDQVLRRGGRFRLIQAKDVLLPICDALDYAHGHGIIHRDLKPANIMVDSRGVPKVMDFGVARQSLDALERLAVTRTVCGTPAYMAPEQEQGRVGRESDIYSLGVCLYELLTERLPFDGAAGEASGRKLSGDFVPASSLADGLSPALDALLARALDPVPERRFHSALEFSRSFEKA